MAPRYRKIDPRIWNDEKFRALSREEKLIALYVLTAQSNRLGFFKFSKALAAEDLNMPVETFAKGFEKVCKALAWRFDSEARVLLIPKWFRYNCPENPNVLKSCLDDLHELPQTTLISEFASCVVYLPQTFHETFQEGLLERYPKPCLDQEQEQEQEQEYIYIPPNGGSPEADASEPALPDPVEKDSHNGNGNASGNATPGKDVRLAINAIEQAWNAVSGLIAIRQWSEQRKQRLRTRLRDPTWLDKALAAIQQIPECPFLLGDNDRGWRADIDWFLKPDSVTRILEGKYRKKEFKKKSIFGVEVK